MNDSFINPHRHFELACHSGLFFLKNSPDEGKERMLIKSADDIKLEGAANITEDRTRFRGQESKELG